MNAARISPGASATPSAVQRRDRPARYAVASVPARLNATSSSTVTSKNSRPLMDGSEIGLTSQATACMAAPMSTGYSTG